MSDEILHRDGFERHNERLKHKTKDKRKQYKKKIHKVQSDLEDEFDDFDPREVILDYNNRQ